MLNRNGPASVGVLVTGLLCSMLFCAAVNGQNSTDVANDSAIGTVQNSKAGEEQEEPVPPMARNGELLPGKPWNPPQENTKSSATKKSGIPAIQVSTSLTPHEGLKILDPK